MKRKFLTTLLFAYSCLVSGQAPNTWSPLNDAGWSTPSSPAARSEAVGFSIGNKGYIGTGTNGLSRKNDFWEFDALTNTWSQKAAFPGSPRESAIGFSIGTKGYIGTGINHLNARTNDFWEYNQLTNIWLQKANFPGTARKSAVGISILNKGYVGTGDDQSGNKNDFWEYDPGNDSWTQKANVPGLGRTNASGFSIGQKGYLGSGINLNTFYEYDPVSNTWLVRAPIPGGTTYSDFVAFSIGQKGYLTNGRAPSNNSNGATFEFNPATNTWVIKDALDEERVGGAGFSIGNKGFVASGWNQSKGYRNDLWEFRPVTFNASTWVQRSNFGGRPRTDAVGFSIGNKGYAGLGFDGFFKLDFWEFDPETNTWSQKANFPGKKRISALGFGIGTKGYVGDGLDSLGYRTNDFWEYNPFSNSWTERAGIPNTNNHNIGFSILTKGYIYSGASGGFNANFFEYNPATDIWTRKADLPGLTVREDAVGFSIQDKGYIGLGYLPFINTYTKEFWEYNPATDSWTQKAPFGGTARKNAVGFGIGDKGYIGSGEIKFGQIFKDFWEYNVPTNTWVQKAALSTSGRTNAIGFSIGAKGFAGLGFGENTDFLADFWQYTPSVAPAIKDVAISNITNLPITGCGLSAQQPITVSIANLGSQPESGVLVGCLINGTPLTSAPEPLNATIAPNGLALHTFSVPANLGSAGTYKIKPYLILANDSKPFNDSATFTLTNPVINGLPDFTFETPVADPSKFKLKGSNNIQANHTIAPAAGYLSDGVYTMNIAGSQALYFNSAIGRDLWEYYPERIGGIYVCFNPSGGSVTDSLWLTFDLKQEFDVSPLNTNLRITANGQRISPDYNPSPGAQVWRHYKINLYQFRNHSGVELGFESLLQNAGGSNNFPRNHLDNIKVVRKLNNVNSQPEIKPARNFSIQPNPNNGIFIVRQNSFQKATIYFTDISGKVIRVINSSEPEKLINLSDLAKGLYLMNVLTDKESFTEKILIN